MNHARQTFAMILVLAVVCLTLGELASVAFADKADRHHHHAPRGDLRVDHAGCGEMSDPDEFAEMVDRKYPRLRT
jgi:hypothetical protein